MTAYSSGSSRFNRVSRSPLLPDYMTKGKNPKRTSVESRDSRKEKKKAVKEPKKSEEEHMTAAAKFIAPFIYLRGTSEDDLGRPENVTWAITSFRRMQVHRPHFAMPTVLRYMSQSADLPLLIYDSATVLKKRTKSSNVIFYLIDDQENELSQYCVQVHQKNHRINFKIGPGLNVASYVAYKKIHVITEDPLGDPRFPLGLGWKESFNCPVICLPLMTPINFELFGVIELSREMMDPPYTKTDLEACLYLTHWITATVQENLDALVMDKERFLFDYVRNLMTVYFCQPIELNAFFSEIVYSARVALCAQSSAFYTLAKVDDVGEIELDMYIDSGSGKHKRKKWFNLKRSRTVAASVARTGQLKNMCRSELLSQNYNLSIYDPIPCHNLLSVPICLRNRTIGVVEIINKYASNKFTRKDEEVIKYLTNFLEMTLSCCSIKEDMKRLIARMAVRKSMLFNLMRPCIHDYAEFHAMDLELPSQINSPFFLPDRNQSNIELSWYAKRIIGQILGQDYMNAVDVSQILLIAANNTPEQHFHGFAHCFSTFHTVAFILSQYPNFFTASEKEELMYTALCHGMHKKKMIMDVADMDFVPDFPEWKPFKASDFLCYLEVVFRISGVLSGRPADTERMMDRIREFTVHCYQGGYFDWRNELVERLNSRRFKWNNPLDRLKVLRTIMVVATCNIYFKTFTSFAIQILKLRTQMSSEIEALKKNEQNSDIVEYILKELPMEYPPSNGGRVSLQDVAKEQLVFMNQVIMPWLYLLALLFPKTVSMYLGTEENKYCWENLLKIKKSECWFPDVSVVSKNKESRQAVLDLIACIDENDEARSNDEEIE